MTSVTDTSLPLLTASSRFRPSRPPRAAVHGPTRDVKVQAYAAFATPTQVRTGRSNCPPRRRSRGHRYTGRAHAGCGLDVVQFHVRECTLPARRVYTPPEATTAWAVGLRHADDCAVDGRRKQAINYTCRQDARSPAKAFVRSGGRGRCFGIWTGPTTHPTCGQARPATRFESQSSGLPDMHGSVCPRMRAAPAGAPPE